MVIYSRGRILGRPDIVTKSSVVVRMLANMVGFRRRPVMQGLVDIFSRQAVADPLR